MCVCACLHMSAQCVRSSMLQTTGLSTVAGVGGRFSGSKRSIGHSGKGACRTIGKCRYFAKTVWLHRTVYWRFNSDMRLFEKRIQDIHVSENMWMSFLRFTVFVFDFTEAKRAQHINLYHRVFGGGWRSLSFRGDRPLYKVQKKNDRRPCKHALDPLSGHLIAPLHIRVVDFVICSTRPKALRFSALRFWVLQQWFTIHAEAVNL